MWSMVQAHLARTSPFESGHTAEDRLLIAAVSPCRSTDFFRDQVRENGIVNWAEFREKASSRHLMQLAEPRLRRLRLSQPPRSLLEESRQEYFKRLRNNLAIDNLTVQVCVLLSTAGVPTLLFNGTPLIRQLFGDLGLQPAHEAHLLVRREQMRHAQEILRSIGFHECPQKEEATDGSQALHRRIAGVERRVILSWNFDGENSARLPVEGLWNTAVPYSNSTAQELNWEEWDLRLNRPRIYALSPEFQVLFAMWDLAETRFQNWMGFVNLCQTTKVYQQALNWDSLADQIDAAGFRKVARRAFSLAAAWGLRPPLHFEKRLAIVRFPEFFHRGDDGKLLIEPAHSREMELVPLPAWMQ